MKTLFLISLFLFSISCFSNEGFKWKGLFRDKIDLAYPLLTIKGSKGFLACAYVNTKICDKTKEACAIVKGVKTHDDMLVRKVIAVSEKGEELGIKIGMLGKDAVNLLR